MFLSPTAQAFQPALEFAIFNDGVPSSVFYGSHPEHDVIHHIPDEAIDELFPPTAEEVRSFSYSMVSISYSMIHSNILFRTYVSYSR
jgi:hypothetical protein